MLYKRSTYALYCLHDSAARNSGGARDLYAFSVLTGRPEPVAFEALDCLRLLPGDRWLSLDDLLETCPGCDPTHLFDLARAGLVLVRGSHDPRLEELRRRHEQLDADGWNGIAATYHFMSRWQDAHAAAPEPDAGQQARDWGRLEASDAAAFLERHGQPPPHFHRVERAHSIHPLPLASESGGLWQTLSRRRTTRDFDPAKPLALDDLAKVLYYVFGCHGTASMFEGVEGIKKTSPSGGGLHPIEVYPLVLNAEGLAPGLYHYNVGRHSLDQLEELSSEAARDLAYELSAGQRFTSQAGVVFLMTARFFRNFWKYRRHDKAYSVLLMDAAHLSQTLYLVAAELGLGAFFTAAVNGRNIENRLAIDGFREGALAICGCGHAAPGPSRSEPRFRPFVPTPQVADFAAPAG